MHRVATPQPGDLAFFGREGPSGTYQTHHVGIYIGGGRMINPLETGKPIRTDEISSVGDLVGYWRL